MPSFSSVLACAGLGLLLWGPVGYAFSRRLFGNRAFALAIAPALGWAVQNVLALAMAPYAGFSGATVGGAVALGFALAFLLPARPVQREKGGPIALLLAMALAAGALALIPASAILPKVNGDAVALAAPIYDHAKVALIDAMMATGLPPANPVYGAAGGPGRVAYYYLWHVGAAQTGLLAGATGWAADIASTWFTSFATLLLAAGLALRLAAGRAAAPFLALLAGATGNLRPVMEALVGPDLTYGIIGPAAGFGSLLFEASWSPHHVAGAACVLLAVLLMARLARAPDVLSTVMLGLVAAAGFEASLWVGGVVFALAAAVLVPMLLMGMERGARTPFLTAVLAAAALAAALSLPLLLEQIHAAAARGGGAPVIFSPFPSLGPLVGNETIRRVLDAPAFLLFLLVELPVITLVGGLGLARLLRAGEEKPLVQALEVLVLISIATSALLKSTAGVNNDLGWRAILPAALALSACAGAGLAHWLEARATARIAASLLLIALAVPATWGLARANLFGEPSPEGSVFARDPAMWTEVRALVGERDRLASNPARLGTVTPWPINISWALLGDVRSCYGGDEMALAFAPLDKASREEATDLFQRVFAGRGTPADLALLRERFGCRWALVTAQDGAFAADPFVHDPAFHLKAQAPGRWRLYHAQ